MSEDAARPERVLSWVVAAATVALCAAFAARVVPVGSAAGRWVYPYVAQFRPAALAAALLGGAAAALLAVVATRLASDRMAAALGLLVAGGTAVQLLLWRIYPWGLGTIVRSNAATSYWSAAARHDAANLLARYDAIAPTLPLHAAGNMPGKLLFFRALHALGASPTAAAVAIFVVGNLVAVLVALVALEVLGDRRAAVAAAALWIFLPARLVFAPILNVVVPLPVVLALWLWLRHLRGRGPWPAVATGAALFGALLLDPTPLGLGLVFVGAALADRAAGRTGPGRILGGAAVAAATVVGCALAFRAATGFDTFRQLAHVAVEADRFNAGAGRRYGTWLVANPVEFLLTLGAPVVVLVAWGLARMRARAASATWMAVAGLASLAALDLLGRNRGEVTRLWIFLAVPLVVAAAGYLKEAGRTATAVSVAGLAAQGATMLAVLAFVIP